jgi:Cys-tRNA(Pro) deacylase
MKTSTPVTQALDVLDIHYTLHIHENQIHSLEQAALERGLEPGQIVRSLVFRCEGEEYVMVLMPGPMKVGWPKLRRHLGVSRITTATAEQILELTGYQLGAVSPLGLPSALRILADRTILDLTTISIGAGIRNAGVILPREDLLRAVEVEIGDFGVKAQ